MQEINTTGITDLAAPAEGRYRDYPDVLTVSQTARILCVCNNTVYKLIREKALPCRRIGTAIRIRKKDVMRYMNTQ